ncbi:GNAT family N-acetyltransferase [Streptomyces sp. WAC06614]|uniref:GNAT family N-acetyltransferase n=1 Tax=Streptomyces sp. WAC06614 TaxID=2487416 RepID=UPI000F78B730|nr:GNAT family N-acetyltransferase [Streptomyces sp. WAC06614]RSS79459.1 GNAT family N-acetyltransferase [Streptomyces sp. WAC06614]
MSVEIRPLVPEQAVEFLRIVPGYAGTPSWEPEPPAWHSGLGAAPRFDEPASSEDLVKAAAGLCDLDRARAAFVDGRLVGTSQMLSLEVTVPGAGPVPMGGLTAVGVLPTHRRRGLLRAMMRALVDDCHERGEALATLSAAEGRIYGRYGFGPATYQARWELDVAQAGRPYPHEQQGRIELVDAGAAKAVWASLHDQVRQHRVGEVSAHHGLWDGRAARTGAWQYLLHYDGSGTADGAAVYRVPWSPDPATAGTVEVDWLEAASAAAYTDVWAFLTGLDLTRRIVAGKRPVDEVLRWQLADPRALRITRQSDDLWVRLIDVPAALAHRTYAVEGSLVVEVTDPFCPWNQGLWHLEGGPDGAHCRRAPRSASADLSLGATTLGAVYLGGTPLGPLAAAGLIDEHTSGALGRATAMLTAPQAPHNAIGF